MYAGKRQSRQREVECRSLVNFTLRPDLAAVTTNNAPDRGETDAGSFKLGIGMQALKDSKHFIGISHIETRAIIAQKKGLRAPVFRYSEFDN